MESNYFMAFMGPSLSHPSDKNPSLGTPVAQDDKLWRLG